MSRYGEATTVSGTGMSARSHSSRSRAVSASSTLTVTASMWLGWVALAYASARSVGRCSLETSTMARLLAGSVTAWSAGGVSSMATLA